MEHSGSKEKNDSEPTFRRAYIGRENPIKTVSPSKEKNDSEPTFRFAPITSRRDTSIKTASPAFGQKDGSLSETKEKNLLEKKIEKLTFDRLPEMPKFYLLQKQHKSYPSTDSNQDITYIVNGIIDCLHKLSIQSTFHFDKATIRAETCDHGKFNVNFFRSKENPGSFIVEIHRLNSIFGFGALAETIFNSLKGNDPSKNSQAYPPKKLTVPDGLFPDLEDKFSNDDGLSAVDEAFKLLGTDCRSDAQELGVETMICLTDRKATISCVAKEAAIAVIRGNESPSNVQEKIYNLVKFGNLQGDKHYCHKEAFLEHAKIMRRGALKVLSNSLETMYSFDNSVANLHYDDSVWFQEPLRTVLRKDLIAADTNPHEAYLASKCLNTMMNMSRSFCDEMKGVDGVRDVIAVNSSHSHDLLAKESHILMKMMNV